MRHRVLAPLVIARDSAGHAHHCYKGHIITDLAEDQRAHLLDQEMVEEIPDATPPGVVPIDTDLPFVPYDGDEGDEQQGQGTDAAGSTPVVSQAAPENPESNSGQAETPARPPQIANKETWVNWAIEAHGLSREAAEGMTLNDLKALS